MERKENRLEYSQLSDCKSIRHCTFLRPLTFGQAGIEEVEKNTRFAVNFLGAKRAYSGDQKHGKEVVEVTHSLQEKVICDALMTNQKGIALLIKHADCQAALLYDPLHNAIAAVHSGWRGSVANIYHETIRRMQARYGTYPADLLVAISPSLGPKNAQFIHYRTELPESFWEHQVKPLYFDFWEISRRQLVEAGVLPHHIEIAGMCTYENEVDCFSYRRNPVSGRHATLITLC